MVFYMSDYENITNPKIGKSKNKLWGILSTIIKSIIVLFIIGFIMLWISAGGSEVYIKDASNRNYTGGWGYHEYLNPIYGLIGIIIYILINYLGFLSYNHITNRFKNYKTTISKIMFILFSAFINMLMLIMYFRLLGEYSFENMLLELFNKIIIRYGWTTFPIIFLIIYIYRKKFKLKLKKKRI